MQLLSHRLRTALLALTLLGISLMFCLSARQALAVEVTSEVLTEGLTFSPTDHPTWGAWGESSFRTPSVDSSGITAVSPANGGSATGFTPTLTWAHPRPDVFYYELQLSKDPSFNTDGVTAVASVYGALIHGGVTAPPNSYSVPESAPLEAATTYYWRVRPRIQGDGLPVAFTPNFSFRTP